MDAGYISAVAGLAGAVIGGLTSFATSWVTQSTQIREKATAATRGQREKLYVSFVNEASRLFADSLSHEKNDIEGLVGLYAITSHIRMTSSGNIVRSAESVIDAIVQAYSRPNCTLGEMRQFAASGGLDPLHIFACLCRDDLASYKPSLH